MAQQSLKDKDVDEKTPGVNEADKLNENQNSNDDKNASSDANTNEKDTDQTVTESETKIDKHHVKLSVDLDSETVNGLPDNIRELLLNKEQVLDYKTREELYDFGVSVDEEGDLNVALNVYLRCIRGLNDTDSFKRLPECLRKLAALYYKKEEYEKAVQFIQAEKLYYETALVDIKGLRLGTYGDDEVLDELIEDPFAGTPDATRAMEYEKLARMCLQKNQPQLALEYQGKATKLRRRIYGEDHNITINSLDFFTMIYAEVGKEQYNESMQKMSEETAEKTNNTSETVSDSTVRRRRKKNGTVKTKDDKNNSNTNTRERKLQPQEDEGISHTTLYIILIICISLLTLIIFYLYCRLEPRSHGCMSVKADLYYFYMRFKYFVYKIYAQLIGSKHTYG